MKALGILLCFLLIAPTAQKDQFELVYELVRDHEFIWTDNLQNLYVLHQSGIEMYPNTGVRQFKNGQLNLGEITSVDFNYSLKPILFYGNMNTIVVLDNTLSMQGNPIKLSDYGLNWVSAAANSVDNHYWFFDLQTFELIRTDIAFKKVRTSGNVSQLLGVDVRPNFIVEHNNWVYVNNPETGILVFDIFGTYFKQIPIKGLDNFQVTDHSIVYFKDNVVHRYDRRTFETESQPLPMQGVEGARVVKDMLFVSKADTIRAYRKN